MENYFIKQLDEIIFDLNQKDTTYGEQATVNTRAIACVARIAGTSSIYYKTIDFDFNGKGSHYNLPVTLHGVIHALWHDIEKGYLKSLSEIIRGDIFSDYLEMAGHLLEKKFKDPAAVLIGSTLENHIRELCKSHGINTEITKHDGKIISKTADVMNQDLAKDNVYSGAYQKQIIAWLGLRNLAAHGRYDEYTVGQIQLMLDGVRQFMLPTK